MRNRSINFFNKADTKEKKEAWHEVIEWYASFLAPEYRILNCNSDIEIILKETDMNEILILRDNHVYEKTQKI